MIEHYWSLCYCWHIQIMSIDDVNTQTIFMVLFTSRSLLIWGKPLRCLIWHLPRVFVYHLLSINGIPFLLQTSYHDRLCLLFSRVGQMGEGDGLTVGRASPSAPITVPHTLPNSSRAVLPYQPQGLGRETEDLPWHHLPVSTSWGASYWGQEIWSFDHMGEPLSDQGLLHGGTVRELTAWVSSVPNWPFALVQLHKDTSLRRGT